MTAADPGQLSAAGRRTCKRRPRIPRQRARTDPRPSSPPTSVLSAEQLSAVDAAVDALSPMTNDQIDRICEVIIAARARWRAKPSTNDRKDGPS